jgi:hypothetical protein
LASDLCVLFYFEGATGGDRCVLLRMAWLIWMDAADVVTFFLLGCGARRRRGRCRISTLAASASGCPCPSSAPLACLKSAQLRYI